MAPSRSEAQPRRVVVGEGGGNGTRDEDEDGSTTSSQLDALDERFPPTTATATAAPRRANPRRSHTDPGDGIARRSSYDSPRFPARRPPAERSRFSQNELRPIQSRDRVDERRTIGSADDTPEAPEKTAGDSTSVPINMEASLPNKVTRVFKKRRGDKRRRATNQITWQTRLKDKASIAYQKIVIERILRQKPLQPTADGRHIPLNPATIDAKGLIDERSEKPYISNSIRSSRYTVYDFLPRQLLFQFSKLGNLYFLVMGIIQLIPGLSTVGRYTTIIPLAVFVTFSMAKEGLDDLRRYRLDVAENDSTTLVMNHGIRNPELRGSKKRKMTAKKEKGVQVADAVALQDLETGSTVKGDNNDDWLSIKWESVKVGDIVRLHRDQAIPADMVLLHATGPNGIAYIDTMALDGETNLKSKQACPILAERCATEEGIKSIQATIVSEDPNIDLYSYDGRVTVDGETLPLSVKNVVYRGSTLRNTTAAIGFVINSGEECKIRMNANKNTAAKKPAMQSIINRILVFQIFIVLSLTGGLVGGYYLWENVTKDSFYLYSPPLYSATVGFKKVFFGFLVMFNTLIPLSLYISLEIVKIGQLILLQDVEMYDPITDTPVVANTTTILENLGQVSYVFSDKTGTLTENVMRFRKMTVAGVACLHDMDVKRDDDARRAKIEAIESNKKGKKRPVPMSTQPLQEDMGTATKDTLHDRPAPARLPSTTSLSRWISSVRPNDEPEMKTEDLLDYIQRKPNTAFSRKAKHFLLCIALCHTCLPEVRDDGKIDFQAASPDELALVEAARDFGYLLIDRPTQSIELQTRDADGTLQTEKYQVLDVIEFSSLRKRMSIIIRMPDGRICVFCKGADNVITARLKLSHLAKQKVRDTDRRASMRKTFEQDKAIRRMSVQASAKSTPRNSFSMKRGESSDRIQGLRLNLGRRSTDLYRLSQSEGVASWLNRRQTEEMATPRASGDFLRTPRHSISRVPSYENIDRRIDESVAASEPAIFENCFQHIDDFASEGLRTLLYAYRYVDEETYAEWKNTYREAETSLVDRQERIEDAADAIEQNFELAGATGIEDKLQDGVPDTIDKLRRANIKVWMLTGDKRETAINIGHSARVCKSFSEIYILDATAGDLKGTMTVTLNDVGRGMIPHSVVVVDGQTLAAIDADDDLSVLFYDLVIRVDSVICCRASPSQKANLVTSIRRYVPESMTLAIGDGANDIGMIQASHVGIGISGREGLQAARISDYSIAQFRFLQRLLFVHGRWNYLRTGKYVLATFWKEMLFFIVQAHFQQYTLYTGTSLFENWSLTVFNSAFTSLPVILMGIFEKDLRAETLLAVPELYTFGQRGRGFSYAQYIGWLFMGAVGSFVIWYFMWGEYRDMLFTEDTSLYAMGTVCFTVGVIFINIKLLILELHCKTVITFGGFIISVGGWFLWLVALSGVYSEDGGEYIVRRAFLNNFGAHLSWWTTVLLGLTTLLVMELVVQGLRRVYFPTDQDLMQRIERDADVEKVLRDCAARTAEQGGTTTAGAGNVGEGEDVTIERGRGGLEAPPPIRTPQSRSPHTPRASLSEQRRAGRTSYDEYRPPDFTPPAEERENPFGMLKMKVLHRGS